MNLVIEFGITAIAGFLAASGGFWAYLRTRDEAKSAQTRLLMGLASDKLTYLGIKYIERGYISHEEFDDYRRYLYDPYTELGGNGTAERVMYAVQRLPFRSTSPITQGVIDDRNA